MTLAEIELGKGIPREAVEDLLFFSVQSLATEYDKDRIQVFFSECLAALELGIGKLYVLSDDNRPMAFGFVFDKYDSEDGAPHLHTLGVHNSRQKLGYGSTLLKNLIQSRGGEGLTLECKEKNIPFFESNGFSLNDTELDSAHFSMTYGLGASRPRFQRPELNDDAYHRYYKVYADTAHRLEAKGLIRLGSV